MGTLKKVLIIDDSPDILYLAGLSIETMGEIEVFSFQDAVAALREAETIAPDVIVLDLVMPEISGIELLDKLRAIEGLKNTPVIFLTGHDDIQDMIEGISHGVAGIISKPFDPMTLYAKIRGIFYAAKA